MSGHPSSSEAKKDRRHELVFAVGMRWPKRLPADRRFSLGEPWPMLSKLLRRSATAAAGSEQPIRVRVLRASTTGAVLQGVERSIRNADILVFDVTPRAEPGASPRVNANVLVEIGLALGMGKRVLLIGSKPTAHRSLPSDLSGQLVCEYGSPNGRRVIEGHVRAIVLETLNANSNKKGEC